MAKKSRLERRGAVYYWRRRIPQRLASVGRSHIRLCLRTKEPSEARFLAYQLDATAEEVFMTASGKITNEQLKMVFATAFQEHRDKLTLLADIKRADGLYDPERDARESRTAGLAFRHLSRFGEESPFDAKARDSLIEDGASADEISHVGDEIEKMRHQRLANGSVHRLRQLLEQNMVETSAINIAAARPIYLRALGDALLDFAAASGTDRLPFDAIIAQLQKSGPDLLPDSNDRNSEHETAPDAPERAAENQAEENRPARVLDIGEKLVRRKIKDSQWDEKTVRQARSIFDLFSRFLIEKTGTDDLCFMKQAALSDFDEFLLGLKKSYGKSPKDKGKTIDILVRESRALPEGKQGLDVSTRNRHYTNLGLLLREARKAGHKLTSEIDLTEFRGRSAKTAREARPKPKVEQIAPIFYSPIFLGCKGWEHPELPGDKIYHGALYFGVLLAVYQGARREEFCGLMVSDVIRDNGPNPYVRIEFTEQRRVKNRQSIRNLALHPEVLRLGFLDYVDAIETLGYQRLFPDLYSPSTSSPMGDRFYDELKPVLSAIGVTPHQLRHFFNNALKQRGVTEEERADLLGHARGTETADRYCDPLEIGVQLKVLAKLPLVTQHLKRRPMRLLPWVVRKEIAPWSREARSSRGSGKPRRKPDRP